MSFVYAYSAAHARSEYERSGNSSRHQTLVTAYERRWKSD